MGPSLFTLVSGGVALSAWAGWLGPEAAEPLARWVLTAVAVVGTVGQRLWLRRFHHVWQDGDTLIVGDSRRGARVHLRDVAEVDESRMQKFKYVKLTLSRPTPLGKTIRFIPRGREGWLTPWSSSPVAADLRARVRALRAGADAPAALPRKR